jgi:hypothetical protein
VAHQGPCIAAVVMAVVIGWTPRAAASQQPVAAVAPPSITESEARVRGVGQRLASVVIEAAAQSKTFRDLIEQINATDGIVYVVEGKCGHGVRACLTFTITSAGPNRVLRILIDRRKTDREAMGSIGHELRHAVEVLSDPTVRSSGKIYQLYDRMGNERGGRFETDAAILAGAAVRDELQKSAAAGKRRE